MNMKQGIIIAIVVASLILVFIVTRTASVRTFEKNINEFTAEILDAATIAEKATNLYSEIWSDYIRRQRSISGVRFWLDGEWVGFSCFSEAVNYRKTQLETSGTLKRMNNGMSIANEVLKKIDNSWFGNREAKRIAKEMYLNVSELCSLANSPTGSLQSFNSKTSELSSSIARNIRELALHY